MVLVAPMATNMLKCVKILLALQDHLLKVKIDGYIMVLSCSFYT